MARFGVSATKAHLLLQRMAHLEIYEEDIIEHFIRGSGSGGQKINKTSSCVQLLHAPSGIEIRCQQERSQALNRFFARELLCERIERAKESEVLTAKRENAKLRQQKRKRSKRQKEKILGDKRERSSTKRLRKPISKDER